MLDAGADAAAATAFANPAIIGAVLATDRWQTPDTSHGDSRPGEPTAAVMQDPEANKSLNGRRRRVSKDTACCTVRRSTCCDVLSVAGDDTDMAFGHAIVRSAGLQHG